MSNVGITYARMVILASRRARGQAGKERNEQDASPGARRSQPQERNHAVLPGIVDVPQPNAETIDASA
jgi:hypothetical protein